MLASSKRCDAEEFCALELTLHRKSRSKRLDRLKAAKVTGQSTQDQRPDISQ